jgi:hypothetical protein
MHKEGSQVKLSMVAGVADLDKWVAEDDRSLAVIRPGVP